MSLELIREDEQFDDLQFKGLKIIQKKSGFCFGLDAVLLANFVKYKKNDTIVDFGTGTGIIPILINAKSEVKKIYAIEIQRQIADMARRSMILNKVDDKIQVVNINLNDASKHIQRQSVDLVVTNPPYMKKEKLNSPNEMQKISRNEIYCDINTIMESASELLKPSGKMYMIHRPSRLCDIFVSSRRYNLEPKLLRMVYPKLGKPANLVLISFTKNAKSEIKMLDPLFVHKDDGSYTKQIQEIYTTEALDLDDEYTNSNEYS